MNQKYKSGNTPLVRNSELCKRYGLPHLLIKDESKTPFGTFKDRRSEIVVKKAMEDKIDKIVLITSGNSGYSLGRFLENIDIKIVNIIDKNLNISIKNTLKKFSNGVIEIDLSKKILKPEEVIGLAREDEEETILDATNGFHEAYEKIIEEIKKEKPDFIIVPVGSGEAFVGLFNGIIKFGLKTKLVGIGVKSRWQSYADKLHTPWTPYKSKIKTILEEGHILIKLEEDEIKQVYDEFKDVVDCEPSSSVVFSVFRKLKFNQEDKIILINSGKGLQ